MCYKPILQIHLNGNLVETRKTVVTFEESEYDYNYYSDYYSDRTSLISNHPTAFGTTPVQRQNDASSLETKENQDSNPVTARFVIAKRGMDVILECHDHDVNLPLEVIKDEGLTQAMSKDDRNYIWRKEGGSFVF